MKKILVVEDDHFKSEEISGIISASSANKPLVWHSTNVAAAIGMIRSHSFDLIILDMALPSHPLVAGGGAPLSQLTGGLEVLFELQSLDRNDPCLVITQFPEIEMCNNFYSVQSAASALMDNFDIAVLACLEYTIGGGDWHSQLTNIIKNL